MNAISNRKTPRQPLIGVALLAVTCAVLAACGSSGSTRSASPTSVQRPGERECKHAHPEWLPARRNMADRQRHRSRHDGGAQPRRIAEVDPALPRRGCRTAFGHGRRAGIPRLGSASRAGHRGSMSYAHGQGQRTLSEPGLTPSGQKIHKHATRYARYASASATKEGSHEIRELADRVSQGARPLVPNNR